MLTLLTTAHLLAAIFWIGGMMFVLTMLIPSLPRLTAPPPPQLMPTVLIRFLNAVAVAAFVLIATGPWLTIEMPMGAIYLKLTLALVMIVVYAYLRQRYLETLEALALRPAGSPPTEEQAIALAGVRKLATINLSLSIVIVGLTTLG